MKQQNEKKSFFEEVLAYNIEKKNWAVSRNIQCSPEDKDLELRVITLNTTDGTAYVAADKNAILAVLETIQIELEYFPVAVKKDKFEAARKILGDYLNALELSDGDSIPEITNYRNVLNRENITTGLDELKTIEKILKGPNELVVQKFSELKKLIDKILSTNSDLFACKNRLNDLINARVSGYFEIAFQKVENPKDLLFLESIFKSTPLEKKESLSGALERAKVRLKIG